jgi:toxin ParE1/3/4
MSDGFVLRPRAQADLDEIWDYSAARWDVDQAETYIRQLWEDISKVVGDPTLGRECPEVRPGYRKYPSGSHVFFYRPALDGAIEVRILHKRMDYDQHAFD